MPACEHFVLLCPYCLWCLNLLAGVVVGRNRHRHRHCDGQSSPHYSPQRSTDQQQHYQAIVGMTTRAGSKAGMVHYYTLQRDTTDLRAAGGPDNQTGTMVKRHNPRAAVLHGRQSKGVSKRRTMANDHTFPKLAASMAMEYGQRPETSHHSRAETPEAAVWARESTRYTRKDGRQQDHR
ncbi:hypothetical protein EJ08DRAFT_657253 [Tothia fuscella]|uniref:Uncharacterized protein n=1 Tax=Tothia fuscella TaxID=1048955 RepID=A0A9P4P050_9PEZI|nr:hypothetical protein EJ08DRAFT_657253 [Tothia fuscella]